MFGKIRFISLFMFSMVLKANAIDIVIDASQLTSSDPIFIKDGSMGYSIPSSGIINAQIENLPALITIFSMKRSGKHINHKTIWLTGNTLTIEGSIDKNEVKISPLSSGKILDDNIQKEWSRLNEKSSMEELSSKPYLVHIANKIAFQKTEYLKVLVHKIPEKEHDFWATAKIISFLNSLENIGYDPANKTFEFLRAMNKNGDKELYQMPKNKFLLIDFSSTSCKPCLADIDKLLLLHNDFKKKVEILSIWDDPTQETWLNIAKNQKDKIIWKSLRDDSQAVFKKFEIDVFPTYVLINPQGQVVKRWRGTKIEKVREFLSN